MKSLVFGFLIVCVLLGVSRPASAAVTASFAIVGPNPLNATCPVNVNFTGSINGPANTPVTYFFARFVNGGAIDGAPINATIPSSGSLAIADTINIDKAHSGFQSAEVDVTSPNAAQGKVFFTVNCQAFNPSASQVMQAPVGGWPPSPTGLTSTSDVDVCAAYVNKLFCQAALGAGQMALIWNWSGNATYPSLDGYKVYRWDGGRPPVLVTTTSAGDGPKGTFLNPPSDGFNGKCYIVTGYVGSVESLRSNQFCVGGAGTAKTTTLKVELARGWEIGWSGTTGVFAETHEKDFPCDKLCIGFNHWTEIHTTGDTWGTAASRSGVRFDVAALSPTSIVKAVLHLHRAGVWNDDAGNCVTEVAEGVNQWWSSTGQIAGAFATDSIVVGGSGPDVDVDVTSLAKHWVGGNNFGLVLRGGNEASKAFDNNHCRNTFDNTNATLDLTYN